MSDMFCYQCQQTAGNKGCVKVGVCGKQPDTARLQDELVIALIRLAEAVQEKGVRTRETDRLLIDGLFTTLTNVNFDNQAIQGVIDQAVEERKKLEMKEIPVVDLFEGGDRSGVSSFHIAVRHERYGCICASRRQTGTQR